MRLIGDLPFFVSPDSSDVWSDPELFLLDDQGRPRFVAGVPPDYFSAQGQLWATRFITGMRCVPRGVDDRSIGCARSSRMWMLFVWIIFGDSPPRGTFRLALQLLSQAAGAGAGLGILRSRRRTGVLMVARPYRNVAAWARLSSRDRGQTFFSCVTSLHIAT